MRTFIAAAVALVWVQTATAQDLPPNHPPAERASPKSEAELLKELDAQADLKGQPKPFLVAHSLGKLYYTNGRFADAKAFLEQAAQKGEPLRALYLEQRKRAQAKKLDLPSAEAAGCPPGPQAALEKQMEDVRALARAGELARATTCARVAVGPVVEVHRLLGSVLFSLGDEEGALAAVDKALQVAPDDADALYLRGSMLLETHGDEAAKLQQAKGDFESYLRLRPGGRHEAWVRKLVTRCEDAIAAGGISQLYAKAPVAQPSAIPSAGGGIAPISREAMEAVQNTERTPELMAGLAKLVEEGEEHLAKGRYADALDNYRRVVPFDPDNGRAKAGMAWAMVGMNRQPAADRVWGVAVSSDPAAVDQLGTTLKAKGDANGARALWQKLAQTDPSYAARSGLTARLSQ